MTRLHQHGGGGTVEANAAFALQAKLAAADGVSFAVAEGRIRSLWGAAGDDVEAHVVELGLLETGDDAADEGGALGLG